MGKGKGYTQREARMPMGGFRFAVGQDRDGRWILCDGKGVIEGKFRDRISAIDHALDHGGRQPMQVFCLPEPYLHMAILMFPRAELRHSAFLLH